MKNIQINIYFFTVLLVLSSNEAHTTAAPMLFTGTIQFPSHIKRVPSMFICSQGCRIQGAADNVAHAFTYTISRPRNIQRCWLVITEHLEPLLAKEAEQNTIQCWRVDTTKPYKFYSLTRVIDELPKQHELTDHQPSARWQIQSHELTAQQGQLPDDTVIIYYDPILVADVNGNNPFEWPTIVVRNDALTLLGSEEALHDVSEKLMIAAMDLRPFFSSIEYEMHHNAQVKTIISLTTT